MRQPVGGQSRSAARLRPLVALVGVVAFAVTAIGGALGGTSTKSFTATIAQVAQSQYTFTLTNDRSSTQTLGSANVTVPAGFTAVSAPPFANAPTGKTWTSAVASGVIELRAQTKRSALAPGESVAVTFTGTAGCAGSPYEWVTNVKQSNDFAGVGNDFVGASPSHAVIGPPATFEFDTIGSPQAAGEAFTATVTATDACGNRAIFYGGAPALGGLVTATNGTEPAYGTLSFANGNGLAAASVTPARSQFGARLTATDGPATGASDAFDVVDRQCRPSDKSCDASHEDGTRVTAPIPPAGATTALSVSGPGKQFTCGGTTYANIGSHVTVDPVYPEGYTQPIQITIEWSLATAPPGSRVLCMTKDGVTFEVPRCGKTPVPPCEVSRSRTGDILAATVLIAPQDPGFDFG